jgi:hypothetical protein
VAFPQRANGRRIVDRSGSDAEADFCMVSAWCSSHVEVTLGPFVGLA